MKLIILLSVRRVHHSFSLTSVPPQPMMKFKRRVKLSSNHNPPQGTFDYGLFWPISPASTKGIGVIVSTGHNISDGANGTAANITTPSLPPTHSDRGRSPAPLVDVEVCPTFFHFQIMLCVLASPLL